MVFINYVAWLTALSLIMISLSYFISMMIFLLTIPESSESCKPSELCLVNGINSLAIPLIAQRSHDASGRLPVKL